MNPSMYSNSHSAMSMGGANGGSFAQKQQMQQPNMQNPGMQNNGNRFDQMQANRMSMRPHPLTGIRSSMQMHGGGMGTRRDLGRNSMWGDIPQRPQPGMALNPAMNQSPIGGSMGMIQPPDYQSQIHSPSVTGVDNIGGSPYDQLSQRLMTAGAGMPTGTSSGKRR